MNEETAFPRGGKSRRTKDDNEEASTKQKKKNRKRSMPPKDDFLFGSGTTVSEEFHVDKKKAKISPSTAIPMLPLGGGAVLPPNKKREALIESISFAKLAKGTKLLAMVRSVDEDYAVLSLPNMLSGYVLKNPKDAHPLTHMLSKDQILAVSVIKTATEQVGSGVTRRRIQVSVMPSNMNPVTSSSNSSNMVRGQVMSIEDHGCLVDIGHGRRGFLKFENVHQDCILDVNDADKEKLCLNPGRIMDLQTIDSIAGSIVSLSIPKDYAKQRPSSHSKMTLSSLTPGTLVEARVESLARNGLCVTFGGGVFRGAIELGHLGGTWIPKTKEGSVEWKQLFGKSSKIKKVTARIICVDAAMKIVRLSLLSHLVNLDKPPPLPPVGTVVENATVVRLDPGVGALLALPPDEEEMDTEEEDDTDKSSGILAHDKSYQKACKVRTTYVHISKAMDHDNDDERTSESVFSKHFCPSSTHTLRILNTHHTLEGVATGATAHSIVEAHVLTHSDLEPGKVYRNVPVKSHLAGGGVICDFGMGVCGLIPPQHLFDTVASTDTQYRAKLVKARFAVGHKVNVRVLTVDADSKRCILTAKKGLVTSKEEPITSFDNLEKGQLATGFISNMDSKALYVTFYNNVYGRVTARSLAAELGIENMEENYSVGNVVQCRVVKCVNKKKTDQERNYWELHLSLKLEGPIAEETEKTEGDQFRLKSGAVLPAKSMKIVELVKCKERETGGFIPGYAVVSIKPKYVVNDNGDAPSVSFVECKLPFDQLADSYAEQDASSPESLDALAERLLTVGKKINQCGIVLLHPSPREDNKNPLPVVSLRRKLIETAAEPELTKSILPSRDMNLVMGAYVQGFVTRIDARHGAFVRFLDGLTGLVPKVKKGLDLPVYGTVTCKVIALDTSQRPMKILLKKARHRRIKKKVKNVEANNLPKIKVGDKIGDAEVTDVSFAQAKVKILDDELSNVKKVRARIHVTMGDSIPIPTPTAGKKSKQKLAKKKGSNDHSTQRITKFHPFYKWQVGMKLSGLTCASVNIRKGVMFVELTNRGLVGQQEKKNATETRPAAFCVKKPSDMSPGQMASVIVTFVPKHNRGLWVHVCPGVVGYIPALELTTDVEVLNNLRVFYPVGARIDCCVMDKSLWNKAKKSQNSLADNNDATEDRDSQVPTLSALLFKRAQEATNGASPALKPAKPLRGDLVVGRINRSFPMKHAPSLMLDLRGGFVGRCCVTELEEVDEWVNMPLGRIGQTQPNKNGGKTNQNIVTDEEDHENEEDQTDGPNDDNSMDDDDDKSEHDEDSVSGHHSRNQYGQYPEGKYLECRVLAGVPSTPYLEVSLRSSRIEGDLDDDEVPEEKEMVQAYVIDTNKKGCFVRLSRQVEGRVTLKEIADGFIPDPATSFPMGRLVVGKVKAVKARKDDSKAKKTKKKRKDPVRAMVDLDMRESTLLESKNKLQMEDVKVGSKHKGIVTRIEAYGVFVRLDNSSVSGLVHKSECSDDYIKNLSELYDPGDLVKVLVVKADLEQKRIGLSMKASHFQDDEDSDDSSIDSSMEMDEDESDLESDDEEMADAVVSGSEEELDSDDENFASKLAAKLDSHDDDDDSDKDSDDDSDSGGSNDSDDDDSSDEESDDDDDGPSAQAMDTDVGFNWGAGVSSAALDKEGSDNDDSSSDEDSDEDEDEDEDEEGGAKSSHKSRKKAAIRRREEQEIARRETALADGTADENPETTADFERLLASEPNRSEHWIRYMAYHLSLADVQSARGVAERAFNRIEFRQEGEKLNVWTALLTLELKYGSPSSLQETIDRACQHNNPKQVYLRVCEMLERDIDAATAPSAEATVRADEMFTKMCKKFKSKKTVWISHLQYLLKSSRHQEAHALLKRALTSLPEYKHVETMSKFAQLEFEYGSAERGRTIFDGVLQKYPKRLDLLFVYVDKEIKNGEVDAARGLFERTVNSDKRKLSDKQMKSLFKKWYRVEEAHGTDESRENVKNEARAYVERSS